MPCADVGVARNQQAALLIGKIAHNSGNGEPQRSPRCRDLQSFAQLAAMQADEVLRGQHRFTAFRTPVHVGLVAFDWREFRTPFHGRNVQRHQHHRAAFHRNPNAAD